MIDHVSLGVADLDRAARFYEAVLGTLGFTKLQVRPATVGFGTRYAEFWLNHRPAMAPAPADTGATLLPAAETTARKETEVATTAEPEKKPAELDVSAVFAKLKQLGGKSEKDGE